ncbi:hypothetical protein O181_121164 [Austropuccinia psidii MF-1]|uniref:Uncharacterized protein n=1 Tax=Austropuccinia psidii MF-1 TaxID=1389203 RepID=A0A9Q3Q136_9BASI|nr:hypothetical protein [Austropuccinia psidii MF-1]
MMVPSPGEATHHLEFSPSETHGPLLKLLQDEMEHLYQEKSNILKDIRKEKVCSTLQTKEISDFTKAIKFKDAPLAQLKQRYLQELEEIKQVLQDWSVFLFVLKFV